MIYTDKKLAQQVIEYCATYGVEHVVISPGSRNAPFTVGFTNHPKFTCYSVVDERSAAFFALGIAQQLRKPTAVVCTSGSALLNYYPAVAEAFYSDIPLVIISADRPKHLIDIGDGQTIRQEHVFQNHSLFNANLTDSEESTESNRKLLSEALKIVNTWKGPVHINVPFDEPMYGVIDNILIDKPKNYTPDLQLNVEDLSSYAELWNTASKKMILVGSHYPDKKLEDQLAVFINDDSVLVLTETTSNLHHEKFINSIDKLIFPLTDEECVSFKPDILLTLGGMVVSKKIKQILRKFQPKHHWHIDFKTSMDTYHCLTKHFKIHPTDFFSEFLNYTKKVNSNYQKTWLSVKNHRNSNHQKYLENISFSDLKVFDTIFKSLPDGVKLQLGNSTVIRYSQLFDLKISMEVYCNRGTSGIDGCTSTAIGAASVSDAQTVFISGDISFFYDSSALWNKYIKTNFRIILINNNGGNIFRFIPGPDSTNALTFFEAPHSLTAEQLCKMHHVEYFSIANEQELEEQLKTFYDGDRPKLLEVFTPNEYDSEVLKKYFRSL